MANGRRKPLGTARVTLAITLGTLGVYTLAAGVGMQSWPLAAIGLAGLVLGVSLLLTSSLRGADRAWVNGTGYVMEIHQPPQSLTHGRCEMQLQIDAPGHPPASVKIRDPRVPVAKWPAIGSVLPIQVATDDIRRVRVMWDDVVPHLAHQRPAYAQEEDIYAGVTGDEEYRPATRRTTDYVYDIDAEPDLPPVSVPRRRPSPKPRRTPEPDAGFPIESDVPIVTQVADPDRGYTVDSTGIIEGDLVVAPATIDVIDFTDGRPVPAADKPPATGPNVVELLVGVPHQAGAPDVEQTPGDGRIDPLGGSIHGVGVTLLVVDVARSVAFYRDLLGFDEIDSGRGSAVLASGDTRIVLRRADSASSGMRHVTDLDLEVGDLDLVYRNLRGQGVAFDYAPRVVNRGERLERWAAAFKDPDGHAVKLIQWRPRS